MTLLDADGLVVRYGARVALDGVSLSVGKGTLVGLLGPNASGKTTLLRALAGLVRPEAGAIRLDGEPIDALGARARARRIAYLEQGAQCHWPLSAERVVALGRLAHQGPWSRPTAADGRAVATAMARCDVAALADRPVTTLSGGEAARVLLARALAAEPDILLADEPVSHLDPYHQIGVMEVLRRLADEGALVIAVLHDLSLAARFCDRLVLLSAGRLAADGPPAAVMTAATLARVFSISARVIDAEDGLYVLPQRRVERPAGAAPR